MNIPTPPEVPLKSIVPVLETFTSDCITDVFLFSAYIPIG